MIPTKKNITKVQREKRNQKIKVHQKISNTFIENAIQKNNFGALKTIYYLSTILCDEDIQNKKDENLITVKIDKREMLKFTELTLDTIIKSSKQMQETSVTFFDDEKGLIEGMSLLPRYYFIPNKNIIEIDLYIRIAKMIIAVKKDYTNLNIKNLMQVKNAHSLRLLALLNKINQDEEIKDNKIALTLEELNLFFGTNYKSWTTLELKIIKPISEELNKFSKLSFDYQSNFENLGVGRPKFKDVEIILKNKKVIKNVTSE